MDPMGSLFQSQQQENTLNQLQQQVTELQAYYRQREEMILGQSVNPESVFALQSQVDMLRRDRDNLQQKVVQLEEKIKRLKGGRMARKDFFTSDGYCRDHRENNCETCLEDWHDEETKNSSKAIVLATSALVNGNEGISDLESAQINAQKDLTRKLRFVKKSLNFTDDQLKKKKIKELPTLIKKAEEEMTIGGMAELLADDIKDAGGVIKGFLRMVFSRHH